MLHAIKVELEFTDDEPVMMARTGVGRRAMAQRIANNAKRPERVKVMNRTKACLRNAVERLGGDKHKRNTEIAEIVPADRKLGKKTHVRALRTFDRSLPLERVMEEIRKELSVLQGVQRKIWYHECFHDERKPCGPWRLAEES